MKLLFHLAVLAGLALAPLVGRSQYLRYATTINPTSPTSKPISHAPYDALLKKYVDERGLVNYRGLRADSAALTAYLRTVSDNPPNARWSRDEQLAYWLNAYNAFTLQRVLRGYPVKSIRDLGGSRTLINTVWDQRFIRLGREKYCLNDLEQRLIRRNFNDYRIHFALVCAALSCPRLRREAYVGSRLQQQLDDQAVDFLNDPTKNKLTPPQAPQLSAIFDFYPGDFKKGNNTIPQTVNRYARQKISPTAKLGYLEYNWNLNEQGR
ncbi:DUF547 domain-containing protein [Hymenobacter weizhouensis]|uniref:DUF547 domain-containing protein n=1 Tax=Hymenobacter sp. YIM 151500-1 TaxID=2987689 RepID=UPI002227CAB1|nr:DUF547 domain-containing protein [Hymenobacter sp. YIM 151500-1]UYZ63821.1 DUF547 domain-containing protein [Hymenobacter sp. YIM 151500-1]